ncbi:hypothetical protein LQ564_10755 [Massilia sp. G4R7]|uniref:Uncharacterized protein n=1 Tax=Massilia phyllostachyos TaxID=2898585 RepID=A0ABS8Q4V8_9BURK|nr:hypothetical protein [Massilia phyllostachyos]MCD2516788.1 hypothetical protein [Massilia phyllostachyos]
MRRAMSWQLGADPLDWFQHDEPEEQKMFINLAPGRSRDAMLERQLSPEKPPEELSLVWRDDGDLQILRAG